MNAPQLWSFPGGIQPPSNKAQSNSTAIQFAGIPATLIYPLTQRQADAIALVAVGQRVLKGEMIARAADRFGAPIHAATSGEIVAIAMRPVASAMGSSARCIVLRSDGRDEWCARHPLDNIDQQNPQDLIERIRQGGVIGAGGAGFPAAQKLLHDDGTIVRIDTLIINGAECEPYITADDRLMRERNAEIVRGIAVLQKILQPQKTLIGIEDDKREAIDAMRAAAAATNIAVVTVPTLYPVGGEGQLIQALTGQEVPGDGKPADIGVLCFNIGTAYAIQRAVVLDEPMISRIVTIAGRACARSGNYETLVGTPLSHLLEQSAFRQEQCTRLISGGALMGLAIDDIDVPIAKTSHCFIAGSAEEFPAQPAPLPCIRCGFCAEVCPVQLLPQQLLVLARQENHERLASQHLQDCIECGACDYVCPSHIPLVQSFRDAKRVLKIIDYETQQAQHAKQRFTAHQQRVTRDQAERQNQREQRLKNSADIPAALKTTPEDHKKAAIQAAIARAKAKKSGTTQRPAAVAALTQTEPPMVRLQQRIAEIQALMQTANEPHRSRLQRALDDLQTHLRETAANPDAENISAVVEKALTEARAAEGDMSP